MRPIPICTALLLLTSGCHLSRVEPVPFLGPAPTAVVVAPLGQHIDRPEASPLLLMGVDRALRSRGYRVLSLEVGHDLLRRGGLLQEGALDPADLQAVGRRLDVDAVLVVDVFRFEAEGLEVLRTADWRLQYRLLSARSGELLWRHELEGQYRRPPPEPEELIYDPFAERPPRPFGRGAETFRDLSELLPALHRLAFDYLPAR